MRKFALAKLNAEEAIQFQTHLKWVNRGYGPNPDARLETNLLMRRRVIFEWIA